MAITDAERHKLHTKLDEVIGEEDAAVLMEHLPPSGWSDVARTRDLDQFEARMDARFAIVDARFDAIGHRFDAIDHKFEAMEHRFEATLERALREQTNRTMLMVGALLSIVVTVQALIA